MFKMESVRCSLVLILLIVNVIHSQQDRTSDMTKSIKDIQQNIKDLKEIIEANNINANRQKDDILQIKDAIRNMSKSVIEMKNNNEQQREDFSDIKDTVKDISQWTKNVSYLLDRACKESGLLCIGPKRYIVSTDKATPLQAFQKCQDKNTALASIDSEEEYKTLNAYLKSIGAREGEYFWTSGIREDASSEFYWKSSGKSLKYTKWYPDEPERFNSFHCMSIRTYNNNAVMSNYRCANVYKYLCEYRERVN